MRIPGRESGLEEVHLLEETRGLEAVVPFLEIERHAFAAGRRHDVRVVVLQVLGEVVFGASTYTL